MGTINQAELAAITDIETREKKFKAEWTEAEKILMRELDRRCRENDISSTTLAYMTDLHPTRLNKAIKGEINLSIPHRTVKSISHVIFSSSCHALYFTDSGTTMLPKKLSYLAKTLMSLDIYRCEAIHSAVLDVFNDASSKKALRDNEPLENTKRRMPAEDLRAMSILNERIAEMAGDEDLQINQFFYPYLVRTQSERLHAIKTGTVSGQDLIARLAINHNTSMDYFMDYDYAKYTKCRLYKSDTVINNRVVLDIISCYLRVQSIYKIKIETMILQEEARILYGKTA